MSIVMGVDPAKGFGWAIYDTQKPPAAIVSGSLKLEGTEVEKIRQMREELVPIIQRYEPLFAAVEEPFKFAPRYPKKGKKDLLTGIVTEPAQGAEMGMNPKTISHAGQIAGAATMALLCWNVRVMQVHSKTWQTIIPKAIHESTKDTKLRASMTCDMLKIDSPNIDSRDAALIAVWCAGHAAELKLIERAQS